VLDGEIINKARMDALSPDRIQSINVLKDGSAIAKYGNYARNGVIEITLKKQLSTLKSLNSMEDLSRTETFDPMNPPLYILDNVITEKAIADKVLSDGIESVSVWKGKEAIEKYGEKGKNGVIEIVTKKNEVKDK